MIDIRQLVRLDRYSFLSPPDVIIKYTKYNICGLYVMVLTYLYVFLSYIAVVHTLVYKCLFISRYLSYYLYYDFSIYLYKHTYFNIGPILNKIRMKFENG